MRLRSQRELDVIKGKMAAGAASAEETESFADYVGTLETLIGEAETENPDALAEWCDDAGVAVSQLMAKVSADQGEAYFEYVEMLEQVLDQADMWDFFGTEGWRHRIGTAD